jgi:cytoskeletal protein CcmA (bactofilin family)
LVGRATKSTTALYVTNYDKVVNVAGNVSIIGNLRIPKGTLDRKNMQGEQTKINIQGIRERSEAQLPKLLKMNTAILPTTTSPLTPEMISENDTFIQNFDEETLVMNVANLSFLEGKVVKGNIIFQSNGTLVLKQNMQLEDVIIKAQSVIVEEGFRGNIQIIAETAVTVEDNVQLLYPSSILIWQPKRATRLSIGKESLMMGGVVVKNSNLRNASESMITLAEKATVVGNMYCHGTVQLNGTVYGSVYADRLHTEYDKSSYANLLMNATIDLSKLPKNFIGIPLFEENDKNLVVYETVKEL